ncbi:MAG: quinolinate synthase NadA, partial [Verrucomicrobiales bacterium]|nr:quinolinate synthase NadA [Verrucomicrobiales bacterium]
EEYPNAELIAHPECTYAVRMLSDEVCSTEKMIDYARNSKSNDLIIATESGMLHRLKKEVPEKTFIPAPTQNCACSECRFMKMNTLEKLRDCLDTLEPQIVMSEEIRTRAEEPILKMLSISA